MKKILLILIVLAGTSLAQDPAWEVNSSQYDMHANLVATVALNTEAITSDGDKLAAFSNGLVCGVASPILAGDNYVFFMAIYSNQPSNEINFRYYDSSEEKVYAIWETLTFRENHIWGSAANPVLFNIYENYDFTPLISGIPDQSIESEQEFKQIDLYSFTTILDEDGVAFSAESVNLIISIDNGIASVSLKNTSWIGSEEVIFKVTDITLSGKNSADTVLFTVLPTDLPPVFSEIPKQFCYFQEYFNVISLTDYIERPDNHTLKFEYRFLSQQKNESIPEWIVSKGNHHDQMNLVVRVESRNEKLDDGNHLLGAFINDKLVGTAKPHLVNDEILFYLPVYSDVYGDSIKFRFYDGNKKELLPVFETISFESNSVKGSSANPIILEAGRFVLDIDLAKMEIYPLRVDSLWYGKEMVELVVSEVTENGLADTTYFELEVLEESVPVELSSFSANPTEDGVLLSWTTVTELNNSSFDIEKSNDNVRWSSITNISGMGTTTIRQNYSYLDNSPFNGINYYRLKQIDYDGTYSYSNIIELNFETVYNFVLEQNYPNPFNPITKIKYTVGSVMSQGSQRDKAGKSNLSYELQHVVLKVYNVLGRERLVLIDANQYPGNYEVEFDGAKLTSGVYIVSMKSGSYTKTIKAILLK